MARRGWHRVWTLTLLVAAGEAVFLLPFVLPRVFRPTLLAVLDIDNTTLGAAFSAYGLVAMVAYFFGGPLADRFGARRMMALALLTTAAGGAWLAAVPTAAGLIALYAGWGVSTILLFWAGLLRATREWGAGAREGLAYGLLDGGRGLFAALLSSVLLAVFSWMAPGGGAAEGRVAFQGIVAVGSAITALVGIAVWLGLEEPRARGDRFDPRLVTAQLRRPALWLQGLIVVCAYVGYKGTDDLSLLASDVLGYDEVAAASVGTAAFWIRPVAAVAAGLLADRVAGWRVTAGCFALLVLADLGVVFGIGRVDVVVLIASGVGACVGVYALRGVYFALLRDAAVEPRATGTAVGIVSVVGYTPDVFFGPLMGWVLDRSPGAAGHADLFLLLAGFSVLGLLATLTFGWIARVRSPSV